MDSALQRKGVRESAKNSIGVIGMRAGLIQVQLEATVTEVACIVARTLEASQEVQGNA